MATVDRKRQRILIIDDESINITILGSLFEDSHRVLVALDGENGLRIARSAEPPDIILLDIMMPEMNGYEVCRRLQADGRTSDIPVIFITALTRAEDESKGLALGAVDFITKPFRSAIVRARVRTHLNLKKQRDQLLKQQQELDRSHQRNLMILETASEGIFGIDKEANITFVNPAALQMIGYEEGEVLGKNSCAIMHHPKNGAAKELRSECPACRSIRTGQALEINQYYYRREGQTSFPVSFSTAPIIENGEIKGAVVVFRDITRRQQLERELYKADKTEAFQVLAGGVAHDFNNLLTVIRGNIDLALMTAGADSELNEYLVASKGSVISAGNLASKFLATAQIAFPVMSRIDIKETVSQVIDSFPTHQRIDCDITVPSDAWPLEADAVQFLQLLENIISNSLEAMSDGGKITIQVENCPEGAKKYVSLNKGRYLHISIQDQGRGIPEEQAKKIFDPYYSTKDRGSKKGMGLGLTICNAIMQKHHGAIEIIPGTEQGTTVHLYFPVVNECCRTVTDSKSKQGTHEGDRTAENPSQ